MTIVVSTLAATTEYYSILISDFTVTPNPRHVNAYPNPVVGQITIDGLSSSESYTINVTNTTGQIIASKHVSNVTSVSWMAPGISGLFYLTVYDSHKKKVKAILLLHK